MNLVNNGPGNGLLSDAAKPVPDPMLTSHQYAPLCLISIQVMTYIDDDDEFGYIIFTMPPGLNELTNLSGKALYAQILPTLAEGNFIWIYNGHFHLKFKHVIVNKSELFFKGFTVNESWRLYLDFFLSSVPNAQGSLCPTRHFGATGSRATASEFSFC